jgi:hypothetical protein
LQEKQAFGELGAEKNLAEIEESLSGNRTALYRDIIVKTINWFIL